MPPLPTKKRARKPTSKKTVAGEGSSKKPKPTRLKRSKAAKHHPEEEEEVVEELNKEVLEALEHEADVEVEEKEDESKKIARRPGFLRKRAKSTSAAAADVVEDSSDDYVCQFFGNPIPVQEAKNRWPDRFDPAKKESMKEEDYYDVDQHYSQALIDGIVFNLDECAYIKAEDNKPHYIGRIVELFETTDKKRYFTAQWFFKAADTAIGMHADLIGHKRLFYSDYRNENPLDCIVSKLNIVQVCPNIDLVAKAAEIPNCDYFYNMSYSIPFCTFKNISTGGGNESPSSTISSEASTSSSKTSEMTLLDLYAGCGGMSTGLGMGASLSGVSLVTKWAVDMNKNACDSLRFNHPETQVRTESAEDFLALLKIWKKLCEDFALFGTERSQMDSQDSPTKANEENGDDDLEDVSSDSSEDFEVERLVGICYGDPNERKERGLYYKVQWKGYGPEYDTWEPVGGLEKCEERICDFVTNGYKSGILPIPGDVDVVCGGPPCQGASGFNRFRDKKNPLDDRKNLQISIFMDIVDYLKPKYVLMENVVDIMRFAGGFLGRLALGRLVAMNYQAKLGLMVAGSFGLPQFRMRVFLWGALPTQNLPQFPLPTHMVEEHGYAPNEFEPCVVAYDDTDKTCKLEKDLNLEDAISDLPPVTTHETRDEISYENGPLTEFQRCIRLSKHELLGVAPTKEEKSNKPKLYDHRPLKLHSDDNHRVSLIPRMKGANFRNLPGVIVGADKKVGLDPTMDRPHLPNGKPLVPDYALSYGKGTSKKPFARLWWDEIVTTVVTRAEPHNQAILHPDQDRVLTIRENARLQGFPDYYRLFGTPKERYIQVGNAVAIPVARALGYTLSMAWQGTCSDESLFTLPQGFPYSHGTVSSTTVVQDANSDVSSQ